MFPRLSGVLPSRSERFSHILLGSETFIIIDYYVCQTFLKVFVTGRHLVNMQQLVFL